MNVYIPYTRLPSAYQEVEYIQSSGTQYIDTGLKIADGYIIKCDTMILSTNVYHCLGGYLGYINGTYWRLYGGTQNNNKRTYGFFNTAAEAGTYNLNEKFNWELSTISGNMYFKWNGTTLGSSTQTYSDSPTGNIGILAYYADDVSGKWHKWTARMYDYQIYDNTNTIIRDFVPCYRKSDSVIGMYDLVNSVFYTNSGSGTFTKGADIYTNVLKNAYIGEYKGYTPGSNTIVYFPLSDDLKDYTNTYTLSTYNSAQIGTIDSVKCLNLSSGSSYCDCSISTLPQGSQARTNMCWVRWRSTGSKPVWQYGTSGTGRGDVIFRNSPNIAWSQYGGAVDSSISATTGIWYHIAVTADSSSQKLYINGALVNQGTNTLNTNGTTLYLGRCVWDGTYLDGYLSQCIIENRIWTADEIAEYYNGTKSNYGL